MSRTTLASDNFNRADVNPLDGSWTQLASGGGFGPAQLVSNAVEGATAGVNADSWFNGITWPSNQWAQVTVTSLSNSFVGISLRQSTSGAQTAYRFVFGQGSTGGSVPYIIQLANAGSFSTLKSGSATLNNGDVISAEAIGTTLNLYINGSLIDSTTDATIASGAAGFMIAPITSTANAVLDSFSGGSFSTNISFVQSNAGLPTVPAASGSEAYSSNVTVGNMLLMLVTWVNTSGSPSISSITDTQGNTWNLITSKQDNTFGGTTALYAVDSNVGSGANTVTVNFSGSTSFIQIGLAEYSGQALSSPIDAFGAMTLTLSTSTPTVSSVTATETNETIIVIGYTGTNTTPTPGSGFTIRPNGANVSFGLEDMNISNAGSQSPSITGASGNWNICSLAVKSTASGPPTPSSNNRISLCWFS